MRKEYERDEISVRLHQSFLFELLLLGMQVYVPSTGSPVLLLLNSNCIKILLYI
jgi:hypothetical protein